MCPESPTTKATTALLQRSGGTAAMGRRQLRLRDIGGRNIEPGGKNALAHLTPEQVA
jgi:hypothetical protein